MTIFDYLKKNCEVAIYTDEYGNTYMETKEWEYEKIISGAIEISNKADDAIVWLIPKEVYEKHSEIEIAIAGDESVNPVRNVRRPYYRMRGVPVTAEQAFDIIRRTDRFLNFYVSAVRSHEDYIGCVNFETVSFRRIIIPRDMAGSVRMERLGRMRLRKNTPRSGNLSKNGINCSMHFLI